MNPAGLLSTDKMPSIHEPPTLSPTLQFDQGKTRAQSMQPVRDTSKHTILTKKEPPTLFCSATSRAGPNRPWSLKSAWDTSKYKMLTTNKPPTLPPLLILARANKGEVFEACAGNFSIQYAYE